MSTRLILFDIDGTLIDGGSIWSQSFLRAFHHFFPNRDFRKPSFGGKTDPQIYLEMTESAGISKSEAEKSFKDFIKLYLDLANGALKTEAHRVRVLPGVKRLVGHLEKDRRVVLGLLTGNLQEGARAKLSVVQLWESFRMGVFSDDHWDRYQLPGIAVTRAKEILGFHFEKKQIVIIGDTIHDVRCGKSLGVRTIGVGTGRGEHPRSVLAENPDYYFRDLSDTHSVVEAIHEELS